MKRNSIFKRHNDLFQTKASKKSQKGQGMTEYLAATALIGVASIATLGYFGEAIQGSFASLGQEIAGGDGTTFRTNAQNHAASADAAAGTHKTLTEYQESTEATH
jgi:Flp pilus assembly pilin Flp